MILHKDSLIELNYDVATDVLKVHWPDLTGFTMPEINYSLKKLIDTLRHYDIKKLLVDSRTSSIADVTKDEHHLILLDFTRKLMTTRLERLARIQTNDNSREDLVLQTADEAIHDLGIQFQFQNFSDEATALSWLNEN
jgi:hypothetical protein